MFRKFGLDFVHFLENLVSGLHLVIIGRWFPFLLVVWAFLNEKECHVRLTTWFICFRLS